MIVSAINDDKTVADGGKGAILNGGAGTSRPPDSVNGVSMEMV